MEEQEADLRAIKKRIHEIDDTQKLVLLVVVTAINWYQVMKANLK